MQGDAELTGRALDSDCIVEPVRGPLIPGFAAVKQAAKGAGISLPPMDSRNSAACFNNHRRLRSICGALSGYENVATGLQPDWEGCAHVSPFGSRGSAEWRERRRHCRCIRMHHQRSWADMRGSDRQSSEGRAHCRGHGAGVCQQWQAGCQLCTGCKIGSDRGKNVLMCLLGWTA